MRAVRNGLVLITIFLGTFVRMVKSGFAMRNMFSATSVNPPSAASMSGL